MRTPVFELHIVPLFRMMDREHMSRAFDGPFDLWNYDMVKDHADAVLERVDETGGMPPRAAGGPWPEEWVQLFRRWKETGFKRLELGAAQYTFDEAVPEIRATGTFPAAGYSGWLQVETDAGTSRTYVLYFEPPDAPTTGNPHDFTIRERYSGSGTASIVVRDGSGVHQIR